MGILNSIVVGTAPLMPKFMIGKIASVYVAGDSLEDGLKLAKKQDIWRNNATSKYSFCCIIEIAMI